MGALASAVSIPVIANGDMYTCADMRSVMQVSPRGAAGVMLGRPVLLNPSLLRHLRPHSSNRDSEGHGIGHNNNATDTGDDGDVAAACFDANCLPIRTVIRDFLKECIRFEPPFQVCVHC